MKKQILKEVMWQFFSWKSMLNRQVICRWCWHSIYFQNFSQIFIKDKNKETAILIWTVCIQGQSKRTQCPYLLWNVMVHRNLISTSSFQYPWFFCVWRLMFFIIFGVTLLAVCVVLLLFHQRIIFFLPLCSGENFSLHLLSGSNVWALNGAFATTYIFPFTTLKALSGWMEVKYYVLEVGQKLNTKRRCEHLPEWSYWFPDSNT